MKIKPFQDEKNSSNKWSQNSKHFENPLFFICLTVLTIKIVFCEMFSFFGCDLEVV